MLCIDSLWSQRGDRTRNSGKEELLAIKYLISRIGAAHLPSVIPASLNFLRDSLSGLVVMVFLSQHEQMVMLNMCKGEKRMVHVMQNQQVRNGAENAIVSSFTDDELVELL